MKLNKVIVLPAEKPGYEFEISEHTYQGGIIGSFVYRKIWPCEDGIYEVPLVDERGRYIHNILYLMRVYLTPFQYIRAKRDLGPRWIDI